MVLFRAVFAAPIEPAGEASSSRKRLRDFETEGRWAAGRWVGEDASFSPFYEPSEAGESEDEEELFDDPPEDADSDSPTDHPTTPTLPPPSSSTGGRSPCTSLPCSSSAHPLSHYPRPTPTPTPPAPKPMVLQVPAPPHPPHPYDTRRERRFVPGEGREPAPRGWHLDEWSAELVRRRDAAEEQKRRQMMQQGAGVGPTNAGYPACNDVGNDILSCYPEDNTTVVQDHWSKFIWNANFPSFINNTGTVDIYLMNADSQTAATSYLGVENAQASIGISPVFDWFPEEGSWPIGENVTIPYYFVIVPGGEALTGGEAHQATFTVIQTAPPPSLSASVASVSSASVASVASSLSAEASSLGLTLTTSLPSGSVTVLLTTNSVGSTFAYTVTGGIGPGATTPGGLQNGSAHSHFPDWAIAVIVILGFLALLAAIVAAYYFIKFMRRRNDPRGGAYRHSSAGSSMNSAAPMVQRSGPEGQNLLGAVAAGAAGGALAGRAGSDDGHASENDHLVPPAPIGSRSRHDSAHSAASRGSASRGLSNVPTSGFDEDGRPFTGSDAAAMADAFRRALRRPEFVNNDPSPGSTNSGQTPGTAGPGSSGILGGAALAGRKSESEPRTAAAETFPGIDEGESAPLASGGGHGGPRQSQMAELIGEEEAAERRQSGASVPPVIGHDEDHGSAPGHTAEDDDDEPAEARELMEKELAAEGRSVTSVRDRRRLEVTQPDTDE